ncbi:MAG: putative sulfate exporter family transporter [Rickettsiales bacterium]|nr:putative sulfate exporter family transporter [Rickettsiales bacterium]|tara:strand:+ start:57 stop:965 length:909 start_codon:yes stop_codon:yes gene_type:complete
MLNLVALSLLALSLWIGNSAISLFLGIVLALLFKLPQDFHSKKYGSKILQTGIVFLGGSLSLGTVYETNTDFFLWICLYVILAFAFVIFLGKLMGISERLSFLLASGTAVCGGTAIASVAPSIKAKPEEVSTALTIVFILNAIAVLCFPLANEYLGLTERQFGAWAALAIHDTASVVGAASSVGEISVEIAATLKVARTIWIVPLVIISAWLYRSKNEGFGLPLFVIFFILAALLNSVLEPNQEITNYLKLINRVCLLTGLFCIGTQISIENLKAVRFKPVILATSVWALIIPTSLLLVIGL